MTMTPQQMKEIAARLSAEAGAESAHGYFLKHLPRLHETMRLFGLLDRPQLGNVLEIGPFYGYVPFFLRDRASAYTVLEGDDPAVYPLKPLYARHDIALELLDLFEDFGPVTGAPDALALPDGQFDTILCWETMEHFNFNPVKFVRDLLRLLKPGGRVYITVPNKASLQNLAALVTGRGEHHLIHSYFAYEDYESKGKKCFYGFHWREYSAPELEALFAQAGFRVEKHGTLFVNQEPEIVSRSRRWVRSAIRAVAPLLPRFGTTVYLVAAKPA